MARKRRRARTPELKSEQTPILPGGAPSALDLSNPRDRGMLRQAMKEQPKRFQAITPEKRDNWVNDLEDVRATAKNVANNSKSPPELKLAAVNTVRACVQTSGMLDAMQQKDELAALNGVRDDQHHLETLAQADRHHAERIAAGVGMVPATVAAPAQPSGPVILQMLILAVPVELRADVLNRVRAQALTEMSQEPAELPSGGP